MEGITILNEFECLKDHDFLITLSIGLVFVISSIMLETEDDPLGCFVCSCISGVFFILTYCIFWSSTVTRYDSLVSPNVSAIELMEHYEVIERKGDIWVLEPLLEEAEDGEI